MDWPLLLCATDDVIRCSLIALLLSLVSFRQEEKSTQLKTFPHELSEEQRERERGEKSDSQTFYTTTTSTKW